MMHGKRVVSPRIVRRRGGGAAFAMLFLALTAIGAAFAGGWLLRQEQTATLAVLAEEIAQERDALKETVAQLEQEAIVLERTKQIDVQANRTAQEELKKAQDQRLALEKEVSFLKRLIREGGGGLLQVQALKLQASDDPNEFGYSFTVSQLIQDFAESEGAVEVKVAGKRDGKEVTLSLDQLPGSQPQTHKMKFKHFQNFEGSIKIPDGLEPDHLIVEIKPSTKNLLPIAETLGWEVGE